MPNKLDITGEKYGSLVALYDTHEKMNGASAWMFQCDCGNKKILPINNVRYGTIKSCGCRINMKKRVKPKQRIKVGSKFGDLIVLDNLGQIKKEAHYYSKVRCSCGYEFITRDTFLITGKQDKCRFCSKKHSKGYKHGLTNTRIFNIWQDMRARCYNSNEQSYRNYGGRGIKICSEWKDDFHAFYEWAINNGYEENLQIERNDVNGDYSPSNCSWKTQLEQARNRRNTIHVDYEGKKMPIGKIAEITGIKSSTIYERIKRFGWSDYDATHILPDTKIYTAKSMRRTTLTAIKTGEIKEFDSCAHASRYIGRSSTYLLQKSYKFGNSFVCDDFLVDIQNSYLKDE